MGSPYKPRERNSFALICEAEGLIDEVRNLRESIRLAYQEEPRESRAEQVLMYAAEITSLSAQAQALAAIATYYASTE